MALILGNEDSYTHCKRLDAQTKSETLKLSIVITTSSLCCIRLQENLINLILTYSPSVRIQIKFIQIHGARFIISSFRRVLLRYYMDK